MISEKMINATGITIAQISLPLYKCPNPGVRMDKRKERILLLFFVLFISAPTDAIRLLLLQERVIIPPAII